MRNRLSTSLASRIGEELAALPDPRSILGAAYHSDWDLAHPELVLGGGGTTVASVPNKGLDGAAMLPISAPNTQPTYEAAGFNGAPSALFPGTLTAHLRAIFNTPIAAGSRVFSWLVLQAISVGAAAWQRAASVQNDAATRLLVHFVESPGSIAVHANIASATTYSLPTLAAFDTNRHLQTAGNVTGGTDGYGLDLLTGNIPAAGSAVTDLVLTRALWTGYGDTADQRATVRIARHVIASAEPTATQRAAMMAYFKRTYSGLTL